MKIRVFLAGLLLLGSTTSALAAGPYFGVAGGASFTHESDDRESGISSKVLYDTGFGVNASAGYNFDPARVEFEFGYKKADVDKFKLGGLSLPATDTDIRVMSYMVNAYFDINTKSVLTPYIGVGIGALNGKLRSPGYNDDDTVFGYQAIAGAAINLNKNVAIDLSYRLLGAAEDFKTQGTELSYLSSNVMAGLRINF